MLKVTENEVVDPMMFRKEGAAHPGKPICAVVRTQSRRKEHKKPFPSRATRGS
jgi:hypothetical protein